MNNSKDFNDFINNWLTEEKLQNIFTQSRNRANRSDPKKPESFLASFTTTHSLLVLSEYHEWLNEP